MTFNPVKTYRVFFSDYKYLAFNFLEQKTRLNNRIFTIEKDIYDFGERIGSFKNEIKTLKQRQEELRKKIDDSRRYSEKDEKTQELISNLKEFIKEFKVTTKKKLEENILNELNIFSALSLTISEGSSIIAAVSLTDVPFLPR